jgi:hypothetical protein
MAYFDSSIRENLLDPRPPRVEAFERDSGFQAEIEGDKEDRPKEREVSVIVRAVDKDIPVEVHPRASPPIGRRQRVLPVAVSLLDGAVAAVDVELGAVLLR